MKTRIRLIPVLLACAVLTACGSEQKPQASSVAASSAPAAGLPSAPAAPASTQAERNADGQVTVTVSTIQEFAQAIDSGTCIILEAGEYNFSDLFWAKNIDNPHLQADQYCTSSYTVYSVENLTIRAADGAEALIVTEDADGVPLNFRYSSNIQLDGLTCGHKTTPGSCMGSVLGFDRCYNISIDNCKLFGCGAYGLAASSSEIISMTGTEIYECSAGIVDLYGVDSIRFSDCRFHDNYGSSLFCISNCWNVRFLNTEVSDNLNTDETAPFLWNYDYTDTLYFENCTFRGNANQPDSAALAEDDLADFQNCTITP